MAPCYRPAAMRPQALSVLLLMSGLISGCQQPEFIELTPDALEFSQRGEAKALRARALTHTKVALPNEKFSWSSKDDSIATVDADGKVTAVKSGQTEVVAKSGDVRATAPVEVRFVEKLVVTPREIILKEGDEAVELKVEAFDYRGKLIKGRSPTFRSKNLAVAAMGQNAVFPYGPGETVVEVRVDDLVESIEVKVAKSGR